MKGILLSENKRRQLQQEITEVLLRAHPIGAEIRGNDIRNFADYPQVNHFILFQIYQEWNNHTGRFTHPYFDFEAPEVVEAMRHFLAVLSQQIRIRPGDFRGIVEKAVYNTLKLITSPEEALKNFFFGNADSIPLALYERYAVYFADFNFVVHSILRYHQKHGLKEVRKEVFMEKMRKVLEIFESKEGNSIAGYQSQLFRKLSGRDLESIIRAESPARPEVRPRTEPPASRPPVERQPVTPPVTPEPPKREEPVTPEPRVETPREEPVLREQTFERDETPASEMPPLEHPAKEHTPIKEHHGMEREEPKEEPVTPEPKVETPREEPVLREQTFERDETPASEMPPLEHPAKEHAPIKDHHGMEREEPQEEPVVPEPEVEAPAPEPEVEQQPETPEVSLREQIVSRDESPASDMPPLDQPAEERPPVKQNHGTEEKPRLGEQVGGEKKESLHELLARNQELKKSVLEQNMGRQETLADKLKAEKQETPVTPEPPRVEPPKVETPVQPPVEPPVKEEISLREELPEAMEPKVPAMEDSTEEERPMFEFDLGGEDEPAAEKEQPAEERPAFELFGNPEEKESTTLADKLAGGQDSPGLNERFTAKKEISFESIPVHKQFQYVQKVFAGSAVKFKVVLDKINKTESLVEAEAVLDKYVFNSPDVNRQDKVAQEFEALVRGRFS